MTIHKFPPTLTSEQSLPPDYDVQLRDCIRQNNQSKILLDALQYFPRLDTVLQNVARHIVDIPHSNGLLLSQCVNAAAVASIVLKDRPFLSTASEQKAYLHILLEILKPLSYLQTIRVRFMKDGARMEWNPLDNALFDSWQVLRVKPTFCMRPDWSKTEMFADADKFEKMLACRILEPRDLLLYYENRT